MRQRLLIAVSAVLIFAVGCAGSGDTATPTIDPNPVPTATSVIVSPTATPTPLWTPTPRPTVTPTPSPVPTPSPTPSPTATSSPTGTATPTPVPQIPGRNVPIDPFPGDLDWLRVDGNLLVDESGETVILRGANIENWQWEWDEDASLAKILAFENQAIPILVQDGPNGWAANAIHIDVAAKPFIDGNSKYIAAVDEMVRLAKSLGAYTVISMRYEDLLDEPLAPTQLIEDGLAVLASRYSNEPAVLYVLGSEPREISWEELKPRLTTMLDTVRANHPRALAFIPGTKWSRYVYQQFDDPIERPNLAFQVNTFDRWELVEVGDGAYFQPSRLDEIAAEYPVLIGGFGVSEIPPKEVSFMTDTEDLVAFAEHIESNGISWTAWLFHDRGCPCMLEKPWEAFEPTDWGTILRDIMLANAD